MNRNIAIVGTGYWGANLVRCFDTLGALKGILDADKNKVAKFTEKYPNLVSYADLDALLSDPQVEAVVIATPVESHFTVASKAILAGKHVFVEKPMTATLEEAEELVRLSVQHNRIILVGHLLEYHPAVLKMRELVDSGKIGRIKEMYSMRLNTGKVRQFENVWWSFAPHDVLLVLNTVNSEVGKISCVTSDYLSRGVADSTITGFKFKNGCFGHIYVSWAHPYKMQQAVIIGTEGAIEFNDSRADDKLRFYGNHFEVTPDGVTLVKGDFSSIQFENKEPLLEECKDFIACIQSGNTPKSSGTDGLRVVQILTEAMRVSEGG